LGEKGGLVRKKRGPKRGAHKKATLGGFVEGAMQLGLRSGSKGERKFRGEKTLLT